MIDLKARTTNVVSVALASVAVLLVVVDVLRPRPLAIAFPYQLAAAFIVVLPFLLSVALAAVVDHELGRGYVLVSPAGRDLSAGPHHQGELGHERAWQRVLDAVAQTWDYEQERYALSLRRLEPAALLFGLVASLFLAAAFLFVGWRATGHLGQVPWNAALAFAISVGVTTVAGFAINGARLLVRIASLDYNARMFTWATRSVILAVVADVGLFIVFQKASGSADTATVSGAVLLGALAAGLGDHAIDLMLQKVAPTFGAKAQKTGDSPLLSVAGITSEDVERFEEEGVVTLHDLAFTPTARLFFNTTHSLQRIVDWQDQALLQVYFGPERARRLSEALTIRGAIDLQGLVETVRGDHASITEAPAAADGPGKLLEEVKTAFQLSSVEATKEALATIELDEPTMRLRTHFRSTVIVEKADRKAGEGAEVARIRPAA